VGDAASLVVRSGHASHSVGVAPPRCAALVGDATLVFAEGRRYTDVVHRCGAFGSSVLRTPRCVTHIAAHGGVVAVVHPTTPATQKHIIALHAADGSPIDEMFMDMAPATIAIDDSFVVCTSDDYVFMWRYRRGAAAVDPDGPSTWHWHVDSAPAAGRPDADAQPSKSSEPVCATCLGAGYLFVARQWHRNDMPHECGQLQIYTLDPPALVGSKLMLTGGGYVLAANCNGSALAVISPSAVLRLYAVAPGGATLGEITVERKGVSQVLFADDDPQLFVTVERTTTYLHRGRTALDPMPMARRLCRFSGLRLTVADVDAAEAKVRGCAPLDGACLDAVDTKTLRDTKALLATGNYKDSLQFVADNEHAVLWELLAAAALRDARHDVAAHCVGKFAGSPTAEEIDALLAAGPAAHC
jgi:WD repeat-containing protein 35